MQKEKLPITLIESNEGQIEGLPRNPRLIRDEKFEALKRSIEEDPEMLELRPVMVYPYEGKYIAIGGNMRLSALKDLGYNEVPCVIIPENTDAKKLRAYTMKDNYGYGEWNQQILAEEWDMSELDDWDMSDIATFDFQDSTVEDDIMDYTPDYSSQNKEIDTDELSDKVTLKMQFTIEEHQFVRGRLAMFDANIEQALLKALGYDGEEV